MTDQVNPGTEPQPTPAPSPAPQSPADMVPVARLNGALAKIQELTLALQEKERLIAQRDQQLASFSSEMAGREAGLKGEVSEKTRTLEATVAENARLKSQLAKLEAYQRKVKIASELQVPGLLDILDVIPDAEDEAQQKAVMQRFGQFAGNISKARESEILAGHTGTTLQPLSQAAAPATPEGWSALVNSHPLGSPERAKALDAWRQWEFSK
jgi:hypothetical protein